MFRPRTKITFTQNSTIKYPKRNRVWIFDFVETGSCTNSWSNLTDTAKITLPKNIYIVDEKGNKTSWQGNNVIAGVGSPVLLRGDSVVVEIGYTYSDGNKEVTETNEIFRGYVSAVKPKVPVEISCEDNMYRMKQIRVANKTWTGKNYTIEKMLKEMLDGTGFTVKTDAYASNLGELRTMNATVAQVLDQLKTDYKVQAYFRGNELRVGAIVYYPSDRREYGFEFQNNIHDGNNLTYTRIDDLHVGIKAFSVSKEELGTNKDGTPKTSKKRLEAFVGDTDGEIRTLYFWDIKTVDELKKQATDRLTRILYEGFRGDFVTFGLPWVRHGDAAKLRNPLLPEMDGTYLIKSVTTDFGNGGIQQKIAIDLRIDQLTQAEINSGL